MRHSTAANFSGLDLLLEIVHGDIHPEITVQVDDYGVDATHGIEHTTKPVVIGNLSGILLTFQSEFFTDELIAELPPIVLRISHMMSIEISRGSSEFRSERRVL